MGELHKHRKWETLITDNISTILLPEGEKFYLGILNGADIYINGTLLVGGIHYNEIEDNGFGVGFEFEQGDIHSGDYITVNWVENIENIA